MKYLTSILTIGAIATTLTAFSIPPKLGITTFKQPDGSTVNIKIIGVRDNHVTVTENGTLVKQDKDGYFRLAEITEQGELIPTSVKATDGTQGGIKFTNDVRKLLVEANKSGTRAALQSGMGMYKTNYPTQGNPKVPVILVEFQDVKFTDNYDPKEYFTDMITGDDFTEQGSPGSLKKYYSDQSKGKFVPEFHVYGPVTLPEKVEYYGKDAGIADAFSHYMVSQSLKALDNEVDFSQYDENNDGDIDFVYIIYAGYGQNRGAGDNTIWPHAGYIKGDGDFCQVDGKWANYYACSNELIYGKDEPEGICAFAHEYSHIIGLPDLYTTTDYSEYPFHYNTPGPYSLLDYGVYNNDGRTPPNYTAYERNALKWDEPFEIKEAATVKLDEIGSGEFGIITTNRPNEFFLFENRQLTGWDQYLPNHGLLIWHIDYNKNLFSDNKVNVNPNHQYVDLIEANNTPGFDKNFPENCKGFVFPGTAGVTEFTAESSPAFLTWSGNDPNLPITGIKETEEGIVVFDVAGGGPVVGDEEPGIDEPGTDEPGTDEPGTDEPGTDEPGTDEPGNDNPGDDDPEGGNNSVADIITNTNGVYNIYTIPGVKVKTTSDVEELKTLDRGIYIINGKKVFIP